MRNTTVGIGKRSWLGTGTDALFQAAPRRSEESGRLLSTIECLETATRS